MIKWFVVEKPNLYLLGPWDGFHIKCVPYNERETVLIAWDI